MQRRVAAGVLSAGHARALLGLPDAAAMERMAQRIVAEGLSVRTVEELVTLGDDDTPATRRAPRPGTRRPQLDDLAADLSDRLETRVRIALGQRKGRLTVEFASVEDLNRILDAMHLREDRDELTRPGIHRRRTPAAGMTRGAEPVATQRFPRLSRVAGRLSRGRARARGAASAWASRR